MTQHISDDINIILNRLIAHPDQLEDVRQILLHKLDVTTPKRRTRRAAVKPVEDDVDFFDNFPV